MAVDAHEHAHAAHHPDGASANVGSKKRVHALPTLKCHANIWVFLGHTHHAHHEQQHHEHDAGVGHDGEDPHGGHVGGHEGHEGGHEEVTDGGDGVHDAAGHVVEGAQDHGDYIQLTVKIGDHEVNGGTRYRAWIEHRDAVMQRLRGWELVAAGPDFATFNIPQGIAQAAANERASKLPKFERKYWGDKTDFCRCLEAILWEMEKGRKPPRMRRQLLAPGESALAQGVGFQRDQRPRPSVQSLAAGMQTHGSMAFASGVDSVDMLIRLLESKDPGELMGYERRIRMLCNKLEMQMHTRELQMQLPIKNHDFPKEWSPLVELPLPPSAPQAVKRGSAKIQRSMMPVRLSTQMEEMQQKYSELIESLQQGFLDPKALGVKSHHESNPAHVGALLKTGLAIMGKESVDDAMEHWMCVPRPRLIQIYIDEFSRIIKSITDQAHQHAQMSPPGPLAKYAQIEPSTYAVQASKERLGDRILHCLNIMVVPIVDKSCTPPQVTKGVMSNPVGMPDDYLIRYLDMLYKNVAYGEREQGGGSLLGEPQEYEILRATLPKDAVPLVEALICAYGGEEERMRLGIPIRRKTAAIERVHKVRQDLEMLAKSADAHIATANSKSPHSAREYHIRAKAKQLGIWLDPSKRTTAADRRRPRQEEHDPKEHDALSGYRSDNWEAEDVGLGGLAFTGHPGPAGGGHARSRPINAISIHRLTGLGDTPGRMTMEEVEARIQSDPRGSIQVVVKIGDHEQNGNFRYKAWAMHRDGPSLPLPPSISPLSHTHTQTHTFPFLPPLPPSPPSLPPFLPFPESFPSALEPQLWNPQPRTLNPKP